MKSLTYQVEKTQAYGTVTVTKKQNYPEAGFLTCAHIPKTGYGYQNICVKYENITIVNETYHQTVQLQNIMYTGFNVYLSEKTRVRNNYQTNETTPSPVTTLEQIPLLVEITTRGKPNDPDYYVPNPKDNGYRWVKLCELIADFLDYIGLSTDHRKLGHDVLQSLLKNAGIEYSHGKIHDKLKELKGSEIKKFLEQKICNALYQHGHGHEHCHQYYSTLLVSLLRKIEFDLLDSIVILLDKTGKDKYYNDKDIQKVIGIKDKSTVKNTNTTVSAHENQVEPTTQPIEASGNHENGTASPTEQSNGSEDDYDYGDEEDEEEPEEHEDDYTNLQKGYRCYYHKIKCENNPRTGSKGKAEIYLLFYINGCQIDMYNHHGHKFEDVVYDSQETEVCVYFFRPDHMPIMLYYNGHAYAPKSLRDYYSSWERVHGINAHNYKLDQDNNTLLLETLINVLYCINPVKIHIAPSHGYNAFYTTHIYDRGGKKININVDMSSEDMKRHKEIVHQAGYPCHVLGQIAHHNHKLFSSYDDYKNQSKRKHLLPDSVSAYFYMYDYKYQYPLLVELFYFDITEHGLVLDTNDYYELDSIANGALKWKKIANNGTGEKSDDFIHRIKKAEDDLNRIIKEKAEKADELSREHNEQEAEEIIKKLKAEQTKSHNRMLDLIEEKLTEIRTRLNIQFEETEENLILKHYYKEVTHSYGGVVAAVVSILGLLGLGAGFFYYRYSSLFRPFYRQLFQD